MEASVVGIYLLGIPLMPSMRICDALGRGDLHEGIIGIVASTKPDHLYLNMASATGVRLEDEVAQLNDAQRVAVLKHFERMSSSAVSIIKGPPGQHLLNLFLTENNIFFLLFIRHWQNQDFSCAVAMHDADQPSCACHCSFQSGHWRASKTYSAKYSIIQDKHSNLKHAIGRE
jgi:hypothetical protein